MYQKSIKEGLMKYAWLLLVFGVVPLGIMWLLAPRILKRYRGTLVIIVVLIFMISVPWEMIAINRIWYYSPGILLGPTLFNLPLEELIFYAIDGLLVGTIAILLGERYREHR